MINGLCGSTIQLNNDNGCFRAKQSSIIFYGKEHYDYNGKMTLKKSDFGEKYELLHCQNYIVILSDKQQM